MNLTHLLQRLATTRPNAIALSTKTIQINYQTLERHVNYWCHWCLIRGISQQRRVALMIGNEFLLASFIFALARLGVTFMTIPRSATSSQRSTWAHEADIDFLIKDDREVTIFSISSFYVEAPIDQHKISDTTQLPCLINDSPKILMIVIGSGSTGKAKLIPITHGQMQQRIITINAAYEYTPNDRTATMAHLEYTGGITRLFSILWQGSTFVLLDRENFDLQSLQKIYDLTRLSATVFHVENMLKQALDHEEPILGNLHLSVTSSPLSDSLRAKIIRYLTKNLWIAYGTNEVWTTTIAKPSDVLQYSQTVGKLAPGSEIQIVNDKFEPLPPEHVGHICIRAQGAIDHYLHAESGDNLVFKDGWFMPKDLGMLKHDGHLIFYGRSDNMMICNGINIYPAEIENCLANHPNVKDAVAIPIEHPIHHQVPIAIVSLLQPIDPEFLENYCKENLGFRAPAKIYVLAELHRNQQGKISREVLGNLLEAIGFGK